jgi:hypothetical protein
MNYNLPKILLHPNKLDYSFNDIEINYLIDAKKDLMKRYYNIVSQTIWKIVLSNLRRRIELYGTHKFLDNLEENEKNIYFKINNTNSQKLALLNNLVLIKNSLKLYIISEKTYTVLNFFYWFSKNNSNENITFEDITSIITLLENNLFKIKINYKTSEQQKEETHLNKESLPKRRKNDLTNIKLSSKKIRKSDLFLEQKLANQKRKDEDIKKETLKQRRKNDFNISKEKIQKRRSSDIKEKIPRRRRKNDFLETKIILQNRRDTDSKIKTPRRRRKND